MIIFSLEISNNSHSTGKTDFASTIKEKRKKTPRLRKYSIIELFRMFTRFIFEFSQRGDEREWEFRGKVEKSGTTGLRYRNPGTISGLGPP